MGRACARLLGATHHLVLTDLPNSAIGEFAETLRFEGYTVDGVLQGQLNDQTIQEALAEYISPSAPFTLIHTAGISPAQGNWRSIMETNLLVSAQLVRTLGALATPGSAAILIASMAGHFTPRIPNALQLLADPLAEDFMLAMEAVIAPIAEQSPPGSAEGVSYGLSKLGVIQLVEQASKDWATRGARIVSISPGTILTPMQRQEEAAGSPAAAMAKATPMGRIGTSMDIAMAVRFLASDEASFITGCDLRVDGGSTPVIRAMRG